MISSAKGSIKKVGKFMVDMNAKLSNCVGHRSWSQIYELRDDIEQEVWDVQWIVDGQTKRDWQK